MRILMLGGDGMLGHCLFRYCRDMDIRVTLRHDQACYQDFKLFDAKNSYFNVDLFNIPSLLQVFHDFKPQVVINASGIIKSRPLSEDYHASLSINALLPHQLVMACDLIGAKLIQFSTDCVFSGKKGNYLESDNPDAEELYGRTKALGEVNQAPHLTLRTSFIGYELRHKTGLLEWFLSQQGEATGYRCAMYSGLTTREIARVIDMILTKAPELTGLWHVAGPAINKFELLRLFAEHFQHTITIHPRDDFKIDRTLNAERFNQVLAYQPPTWSQMLGDLHAMGR